jgi:hypothetical protein
MKKIITIIMLFSMLSFVSIAKDNLLDKPLESFTGLTNSVAKVPFTILKESAKKLTSIGTKPLLFGMSAIAILSEGFFTILNLKKI